MLKKDARIQKGASPDPDRDLVKETIINRRFGALKSVLINPNDVDAADTLVQWAYLTSRPPMKAVKEGETPPKAEDILKKIQEAYGQEISDGKTKQPLESAKASLKSDFENTNERYVGGDKLLKLSDPQKKALVDAINRLQGDIEAVTKKFPLAPKGTVGQPPTFAQNPFDPRNQNRPNGQFGNNGTGSGSNYGQRGSRNPAGSQAGAGSGSGGGKGNGAQPPKGMDQPKLETPGTLTFEAVKDVTVMGDIGSALAPRRDGGASPFAAGAAAFSAEQQQANAAAAAARAETARILTQGGARAAAIPRPGGRSVADGVAGARGDGTRDVRESLFTRLPGGGERRDAGAVHHAPHFHTSGARRPHM